MHLRPYGEADLALTAALEIDPVVMRHLGGAAGDDRVRVVHEKRLAGVAAGDRYRTVTPAGAVSPVGIVAIWRTRWEEASIFELGVMFLPAHQRLGLGLAAARLLLEDFWAAGVSDTVHAFTAVDNVPAGQACIRLGFQLEGDCDLDYEGRPLRCHHWLLTSGGPHR